MNNKLNKENIEENNYIIKNKKIKKIIENANKKIIGINPFLGIYTGYDSEIIIDLNKNDKIELANYMIKLWKKFKEE